MPREDFDLDSLARYLHLTPAQVQKLAERGNVPGRKISGQWKFSRAEIHHWLEERIGAADDADLQDVEKVLNRAAGVQADTKTRIVDMLSMEGIAVPLAARTRSSVIQAMVDLAAQTGLVWDPEKLATAVRERENLHPTALANGVALLHPRRPLPQILAQPLLALGRTQQGIPFGASGGQLTDIFFLICSVDDAGHLRTLARLSRLVAAPAFLPAFRDAADARQVLELIEKYEDEIDPA